MDINQLKYIQPVLDDFVNKNQASGLNLLIYKDNQELGYWQSGLRDLENNQPYDRNTIVRLFSMSKPVTAVAAMMLAEEGKLDPAEEVWNYLPEYKNLTVCTEKGRKGKARPAWSQLLVKDLLNMTGGYTYGAWSEDSPLGEHLTSDLIAELNKDAAGENRITTREVAKRLAAIPLSFDPGTDYSYGLCADILGAVIEAASGMKFSDFLKKRIFNPLGMKDTDFYVPEEKQKRLAKVYRSIYEDSSASRHLEQFTDCNLGIQYKMNKAPAFESGGAGLCSTVDDYMRFAHMLSNGGSIDGVQLLHPATVKRLASARLMPELQKRFDIKMPHLAGYSYCNLLRVAENADFGWDGWLGPFVSMDINTKLTIVMTMQRCDSGTTTAARRVQNILYNAL